MNPVALWVALGVFLVSVVTLIVLGKLHRTWYMVYLANPEMSEHRVYRTFWDKMWLGDWSGLMVFRAEGGKVVRIGKHWIIKIVEE